MAQDRAALPHYYIITIKTMKKTRTVLLAELWTSVLLSLIIVVLYETDLLTAADFAGDKNTEFLCVTLMEVMTICLIPLALRLFKFKTVATALTSSPASGLMLWGTVRMMMLCVPIVVNTLLYYQFMNVALGYMAIIGLICLVFVYPGKGRCEAETNSEE